MIGCSVLDDGKPKTGTAGCFGATFIYTIEPFKDPILMLHRDTDAGITDNQAIILCMDRHDATGNIVLDSIVAKVV